ncbi:AMP-binding protein [Larkinella rosea]|uniref:O-succinylbenzoic acid--CoA ligase n=1 Tax=Larkinella rosea TaxID=2025312 RepID=A0A3P1C1X1_9BACT|nr:AMP-binding protein [Larkinella rosea]RRB07063.1 O-succinylbenzoic acid--CoA ligase [Larkinella rosea]
MRIAPGNLPDPQTDYEAKSIAFCRAWISGQTEFTLSTSGSTGTPKPIRLTRRQMVASARLTGHTFGLKPGDRALVCLHVDYIAGIMMLVRGLELGLILTIIEPASNPIDAVLAENESIDFAAFVPLQLHTMLDAASESLPVLNQMKAILVGGAAVDHALAERLQAIEAPVFSTYGMTETVSHIAVRRLNGPNRTDVFRMLPGVEWGLDERNCLFIKAAATDFAVVQTNDVVEVIDSFHFRLVGRADSIINSGGVKVQPELVEKIISKVLMKEAIPSRFFVYGLPDERLGQQVALFVEQTTWDENRIEQLKIAVRAEMGPYAVPRKVIFLPVFAETPTGKIDKKAIASQLRF